MSDHDSPINVNDVIVFNPQSFEDARLSSSRDLSESQWLYCDGMRSWRGESIPFVSIAIAEAKPPTGTEDLSSPADWFTIPCAPTSCALVVEKDGFYVRLLPLNDDYRPPQPLERVWVSEAVLGYGLRVGMLQVLP